MSMSFLWVNEERDEGPLHELSLLATKPGVDWLGQFMLQLEERSVVWNGLGEA